MRVKTRNYGTMELRNRGKEGIRDQPLDKARGHPEVRIGNQAARARLWRG